MSSAEKGHVLSPAVDLCEVIESGGQWPTIPLDVLRLLRQVLGHHSAALHSSQLEGGETLVTGHA